MTPAIQKKLDEAADFYVDETLCGEEIDEELAHKAFLAGADFVMRVLEKCREQRNYYLKQSSFGADDIAQGCIADDDAEILALLDKGIKK
jgi:hypothetical protein